jgi:hypothetical protein
MSNTSNTNTVSTAAAATSRRMVVLTSASLRAMDVRQAEEQDDEQDLDEQYGEETEETESKSYAQSKAENLEDEWRIECKEHVRQTVRRLRRDNPRKFGGMSTKEILTKYKHRIMPPGHQQWRPVLVFGKHPVQAC